MNIAKLKQLIKDLPDEMEVVLRAPDHSYAKTNACLEDAILFRNKHGIVSSDIDEYYGYQNLRVGQTIEKVFVVD